MFGGKTQNQMAHGDAVIVRGIHRGTALDRPARDNKAFGLFLNLNTASAQASRHKGYTVAFLHAHFANAAHHRLPLGKRRRRRKNRIFVDHGCRTHFRYHNTFQLRITGRHIAHLFATCHTAVRDRDVGSHIDPSIKQGGPKRVQHHAFDRHVRARHNQCCRQREGRRRRIARHRNLGAIKGLTAFQRNHPAFAHFLHIDLGPEGGQHALGMVPALFGFDDASRALGIQTGQQNGRLHLRRGHRLLEFDRRQLATFDHHRQAVFVLLPFETCAHRGQRPRHTLHRTLAQRNIAIEGDFNRITGHRPHQKTYAGSGIAAVNRIERRLQTALARHLPVTLTDFFDLGP